MRLFQFVLKFLNITVYYFVRAKAEALFFPKLSKFFQIFTFSKGRSAVSRLTLTAGRLYSPSSSPRSLNSFSICVGERSLNRFFPAGGGTLNILKSRALT